jgi:phosphoribosylpyrophosphate synthetase
MGVPIFGVNIPAPIVKIDKFNLEKYADLYKGIRNRKDTVTWRTLITLIRSLLGVTEPDHQKISKRIKLKAKRLINQLVKKTYLEILTPEIEYAVGIENKIKIENDLDYLILNAKHSIESSLWDFFDFVKSKNKKVAIINPVGHYNDGQTRIIGPYKFFRKIKKVIIIASTQNMLGGSVSTLSNVIRLIRNAEFSKNCAEVDVIIPMFGGSRGHRLGQSSEVGYEVMEASFNARLLAIPARDILDKLKEENIKVPKLRFFSVDIHNIVEPFETFKDEGFEFFSIDSSSALASGIIKIIKIKRYMKFPVKIVACDKGAVPRTEKLAESLLKIDGIEKLEVIYIEKKRMTAGVVGTAEIVNVSEWKVLGNEVVKRKLKIPKKPNFRNTSLVFSDDMIDTGGTAEKDLKFVSYYYPNALIKIFAATHPVFSKGFSALKRIGADYYCVGNTLYWEGLKDISNVEIIDMSEAIYKAI